jgi:hypothetical protein
MLNQRTHPPYTPIGPITPPIYPIAINYQVAVSYAGQDPRYNYYVLNGTWGANGTAVGAMVASYKSPNIYECDEHAANLPCTQFFNGTNSGTFSASAYTPIYRGVNFTGTLVFIPADGRPVIIPGSFSEPLPPPTDQGIAPEVITPFLRNSRLRGFQIKENKLA